MINSYVEKLILITTTRGQSKTNKVDINDSGSAFLSGVRSETIYRARHIITLITGIFVFKYNMQTVCSK